MKFSDVKWKLAECNKYNNLPPYIFAPERYDKKSVAQAKAICAVCSIKDNCLEFALSASGSYIFDAGIYGGTTPKERQKVRDQRNLKF